MVERERMLLPDPELSRPALVLAQRFVRRWDLHACQLDDGSYVCVHEQLNVDHLFAHLRGEITLGAYLLDQDSQARFLVLDADDAQAWERLGRLGRLARELAMRLSPDTAQFFPLMVYPGTKAYEWAKRNGYLTTQDFREWLTADGLHRSVVNLPGLSAEAVTEWCDNARRSFYVRPRYILAKAWQVIAHPSEARRILRAACVFARYLFRRVA